MNAVIDLDLRADLQAGTNPSVATARAITGSDSIEQSGQLDALRLPIGAWLRLLWNVTPPLLHLPAGIEGGQTPFLAESGLHLPSPPAGASKADARRWYSAAAAHAAAHIVFSRRVFVREGTAPITQALLGLLEDARAEALACRELPGLRRLWAPLHTATPEDGDGFETLMLRLARGLVDPGYDDPHPWVRKGRARFYLDDGGEVLAQSQPDALRAMASALGNDIGQMRMGFNARMYRPGPSYRDDNRWLWQGHAGEQPEQSQPVSAAARLQEGPADATPPAPVQWRYPEWDRRIGKLRTDWCVVHERHPQVGESVGAQASAVATLEHDAPVQRALTLLLQKSAMRSRVLRRRERDGDDIELDEAVSAVLAQRSGSADELRVHTRSTQAAESVAVLLLIDSSASSARPHGSDAAGGTQLTTQQRVARLLAGALATTGGSLAIQGFDSDGREGVNHWRVKDFDEAWSDGTAARLASLQSGLSTRLGAALRHATRALTAQPASRRLVVVMSDGEPHDVDIHDPHYLIEDARHAVQSARLVGIGTLGLLLDAEGAAASRRIFGAGQSALLGDAASLPSVLGRLLG